MKHDITCEEEAMKTWGGALPQLIVCLEISENYLVI